MRREDVLKDLIHTGNIEILNLGRRLLALTPPDLSDTGGQGRQIGEVWRDRTQYLTLDRNSAVQPIQGAKYDRPLFRPTTPIMIDATWELGITDPIMTTFGKLLFNVLTIRPAFGDKLGYINDDHVDLGKIDNMIAKRLRDKPADGVERNPSFIYTDELVAYQKYTRFLEQYANLVNISATPKTIVPPPNIRAQREALLAKYQDKLHDPVAAVQFENEMKAIDNEFLKDDPGNGVFLAGKVKGVARKRLYLTGGIQLSFDKSKTTVVPGALVESWDTDPDNLVKMINDARVGSLSRGSDTIKGGVTAKQLLRPVTNYTIVRDSDCRSSVGLRLHIKNKDTAKRLEGRYIIVQGQAKLIENIDAASHYVGQTVTLRSPGYCVSKGQTFCAVCAGRRLTNNSESLSIAVTEISNIVLYSLMKLMHGVEYSLTTVELEDIMT